MKKILFFVLGAAILLAWACQARQPDVAVKVAAQDVYEGVLPAADGPGIKTTLTLGPGNSFVQVDEYLDEPDGVFMESGRFTQNGNIITLELQDGPIYYLLAEDSVVRLGPDQKAVEGPLASFYVLEKK